jgi:phosphoglycolate phosphatase
LRYTALSFDLDGTLVDTAGEIAHAANRALAEFGVPAQPQALITRLIGGGTRQLMLSLRERVQPQLASPLTRLPAEELLAGFERHYSAIAGTIARPYEGCLPTLQRLHDAGVRLACITNKEGRYAARVLQGMGLEAYFGLLIAGDTLPYKKPDRRVIDHALHAMQAQPKEFAHIGDSAIDIDTARNAGVAAWALPYGYNAGLPIEACAPDHLFRTLGDIAEHVLAQASSAPGAKTGATARHS